jgi:ABC-2 type transport system permease protein
MRLEPAPGSLLWFARHEARLAWRDTLAMIAGRHKTGRRRLVVALFGLAVFLLVLHLVALGVVRPYAEVGAGMARGLLPEKSVLVAVMGSGFLALMLMLSQAMETATRVFYARADLDLILASPARTERIFAIRIAAIAGSSILMSVMVCGPFINVLALFGGARWLAAYGVMAATGAVAAAFAVALSVALFRLIGPRRTRVIAQVVAAIIGAAFVIGLQVVSIMTYGKMSRLTVLSSDSVIGHAPDAANPLYLPARAMLGDPQALLVMLVAGAVILAATILVFAPRFGDHALAAGSIGATTRAAAPRAFRVPRSPRLALILKEWALIARDPWLLSQTLMQILYLIPPALLLWVNFGEGHDGLVVLVPVLVMAAGQLAGGLAWLALSAEDAPDLMGTAPVAAGMVSAAKSLAVLGAVVMALGPLLAVLAFAAPKAALISFAGILCATLAATWVQMRFRSQARRALFRRRQTSSRLATFVEAIASIGLAGAAGLMASGAGLLTLVPLCLVGLILIGTAAAVSRPPHWA